MWARMAEKKVARWGGGGGGGGERCREATAGYSLNSL